MKTVLITGGNSGIGKATATQLAARGFHVFIAARNLEKSRAVVQEIEARHPGAKLTALPLDLADLDNVRAFAADFRTKAPVLDVLILNAGLFPPRKQLTKQGFEMQFGVNHLGHFLLTHLLLDTITAAPAGRIVIVSSILHWLGRINFNSFRGETLYNPVLAYGQSKIANVMFMQELARRLATTNVRVNALHPGGVASDIARDLPGPIHRLYNAMSITAEQGAQSSVFLAADPAAEQLHGKFLGSTCKVLRVSPVARPESAAKLWAVSEQLCGITNYTAALD
jgi:NAD(P)-dependent dehydrogenase (short-subunit alcohol dehydrogenase family)